MNGSHTMLINRKRTKRLTNASFDRARKKEMASKPNLALGKT
jgi:hypothetical protein